MDSSEVFLLEGVGLRSKQMEDPWIRKVIEFVEHEENLSDDAVRRNPSASNIGDFSIQNCILYIANFHPDQRSWKLVIPN